MSSRHLGDLAEGNGAALLAARAAAAPDRTLLIFGGTSFTYRQVDEAASQVACALIGLGLQPGDAVAVLMSNRPEFLFAVWGIGRAGLRFVPVNTAYKGSFLAYVIDHSESKAVVTETGLSAAIADLGQLPSGVSHVICVGSSPDRVPSGAVALHEWAELLAGAKTDAQLPPVSPGDIAAISYTSGTTGRSKGVLSPALQGVMHAREAAAAMGTTSSDRIFTCLPLFHGAALSGACLSAVYAGAMVCLAARFSASRFWDEVRDCGATQFQALGSILPMLLAQPATPHDREHSVARVFAAPAPPEVLYRFEERFGVHVVEGYGSTETKNISYNPIAGRRVGSFGKPTATSIIEVHDELGRPLPAGEVGEIVYRPRVANVMTKGYHRDPEATVAATSDMWWHTGDLGYTDQDGFFYFVDRMRDSLRRRGENISSQEVESALMSFAGVLDAAVVAARSELGEDEVLAVLEVADPASFDLTALFGHCDRVLPHFMVPRFYRFAAQMPRTPNGKVRKVELRQQGLTAETWDAQSAGLVPTRAARVEATGS